MFLILFISTAFIIGERSNFLKTLFILIGFILFYNKKKLKYVINKHSFHPMLIGSQIFMLFIKYKFKIIQKESDWKTYWSSNSTLKSLVKNEPEENFERRILHFCISKKQLTFARIKKLEMTNSFNIIIISIIIQDSNNL